jgi:hypothetical protein
MFPLMFRPVAADLPLMLAPGPLVTALSGGLTFLGAAALGIAMLRPGSRGRDSALWFAAAPVVGLAAFSTAIELLAMAGAARPTLLIAVWGAFALGGVWFAAATLRAGTWRGVTRPAGFIAVVSVVTSATILCVALAPSAKIDETYYHMLVPARVLWDGALHWYHQPWEASIIPQMVYQIGHAPLHALGAIDGANVLNWALGMWLAVSAGQIVTRESGSAPMGTLCGATLCIGMYPVVQYSASGSTVLGDLAGAVSLLALARALDAPRTERTAPAVLAGIAAACGAAAKTSAVPLLGLIALASVVLVSRSSSAGRWRATLAIVIAWVAMQGTAILWTWTHTGSPLGPLGAGVFAASTFTSSDLAELDLARRANQWSADILVDLIASYSPVLWLMVAGILAGSGPRTPGRRLLIAALIIQVVVVVAVLPHFVRFLSGVHIAAAVVGAIALAPRFAVLGRIARGGVLALLVPWIVASVWYASRLAPAAVGLQSREAFEKRYVALSRDYRVLDSLLPDNASLLVVGLRPPAVYSPRPLYFDQRDVPRRGPAFLLQARGAVVEGPPLALGRVRYENDSAVIEAYRTPGRAPLIGSLRLVELIGR